MSDRVFITGIGIISALGNGIQANLQALKNESSGIDHSIRIKDAVSASYLFGEVSESNRELAAQSFCGRAHNNSRTALLGLTAAYEALRSASLDNHKVDNFGLVNGTSVGGMDVTELNYHDFTYGKPVDFQEAFSAHDCGFSAEYIADSLGIRKHVSTVSTACSSSANSIYYAAELIKNGQIDGAIAGGSDALSYFTFHGFNSLLILDPEKCKPFDGLRKGLNLGEGAAFLVLESEKNAERRKVNPIAELAGYGNASDAFHQTASSPDGIGATLAMEKSLKMANFPLSEISYINAHGTGTENNDQSECTAIKNIFGDSIPEYSSTKSYTGHTLGAAGAIEAVYSILAIQEGIMIANQKILREMDVLSKPPIQSYRENEEVRNVLSNSFGFGGNCTSLIFSRLS